MKLSEKSAAVGLIIGCILFGLGSVIVANLTLGSNAITFWRLAIAAVIFFVLMRISRQFLPKNPIAIKNALIAGIFLAFDLALWHESIYAVGPGISTLLNSLQIFWITAIGYIWFNEKQTPRQLVSLLLAIIGVGLIGSPEFKQNENALWGFLSGVGSGIALAISMVYVKKTHQVESTGIFPLMFMISIAGMLIMVPFILFLDSERFIPNNITEMGLLFIYGAVMQCIAWGLIAYSIPILALSLTGLLLLTEPIAALLIDYFFLDKHIFLWQWIGILFTLFGIYLGSLKAKH